MFVRDSIEITFTDYNRLSELLKCEIVSELNKKIYEYLLVYCGVRSKYLGILIVVNSLLFDKNMDPFFA